MRQQDNSQWILRTVRRILREVGPKTARRFLESRGGTARWQAAAQEIGRQVLREQSSSTPRTFSKSSSLSGV
jgi:histone H3/H4